MRLSERKNVDLPQPEGPMSAVTERSSMFIDTGPSAVLAP